MSELIDLPAAPLAAAASILKPSKRKLVKWVATPLAGVAFLCVLDVQTTGQQKAAECESTQQAVAVPKPHIWLAGAITGAVDQETALRDVMASSHPDVALTDVIAANSTLTLTAMGNVPAAYGGVACLNLPTVAPAAPATAPKAVAQGKAPGGVLVLPKP